MGKDNPGNSETEDSEGLTRIKELLEPVLPRGEPFSLIHIRSVAQKCRKLVFTATKDTNLDAVTTHYFVLSHKDVAVVTLEVYAYESMNNLTIFISKADTTGHYYGPGRLNVMAIMQAWVRSVYRHYSPAYKPLRLALFAKAEGQYLFLGSIKNPRKHILSDSELVKWWLRCLDGLSEDFVDMKPGKCALSIPGIDDPNAIAKYFPPQSKLPWTSGDIYWDTDRVEDDDNAIAVKRIPRFPDDPKSRFLDALVSEKRAKQVTRRQFWLELQSRQEFRLGKSVGIIGIEARLRPGLNEDLTREAKTAVSKRDATRFKDLLTSLNFETLDSCRHATERLSAGVSDIHKTGLMGKRNFLTSQPSSSQPAGAGSGEKRPLQINTLGGGLIRKKKKVDA